MEGVTVSDFVADATVIKIFKPSPHNTCHPFSITRLFQNVRVPCTTEPTQFRRCYYLVTRLLSWTYPLLKQLEKPLVLVRMTLCFSSISIGPGTWLDSHSGVRSVMFEALFEQP